MSLSLKDFEIMAPVGSRESLAAAIQAGADSIYFGIENLNMRARSANTFTIDDLREIARTCDEHGMKSCGDRSRCGGDELCPSDRAGGTPFHSTEHLQCRGFKILRTICRCGSIGP